MLEYKIRSVRVNHLKKILPAIISKNQPAFILGRSITDNLLLNFEMIHFMKQKNSGTEGEVALKLDINKAYDRVIEIICSNICLGWVLMRNF